jgi:aminopeptidase N
MKSIVTLKPFYLGLTLLFALVLASSSQAKPAPEGHSYLGPANSANYDVVYHRLSIYTRPDSARWIKGTVTTWFKTTVNNVASIQFDFDNTMTVNQVLYHGSPATFVLSASDILTVTVPNIATSGTLDSVFIDFKGTPATPATSIPSGFNRGTHNGANYAVYTLDEAYTGYTWWPCKETLYDKVDSVDFIITTPSGYRAGSNGTVTEIVSGTQRVCTWKTRYPIANYHINFAVANYNNYQYTINTGAKLLPVLNYFYPEDDNATYHGYVDVIQTILPAFVTKFGNYPFLNEKYGHSDCFSFGGALEVQTMTSVSTNAFSNKYTLAHELSHQWFGDKLTTNSWHQIWLNEGFARYNEVLCAELVYPAQYASSQSSLKSSVTNSSTTYVTDTSTVDKIFIPSSSVAQPYEKGAMLVSMLRTWLGDAKYFTALNNYVNSPTLSYNFTAVDSLRRYMEASTAGLNLTEFFNDWVYQPGRATYAVTWYGTANSVTFRLVQSQTNGGAGHFDMPVPIRITGPGGLDTTVVILDRQGQLYNNVTYATNGSNTITFPLSKLPTAISFDPGNLVLATASSIAIDMTLPVSGIDLHATGLKTGNRLSWTFQSTRPLSALELQKSVDGVKYLPISRELPAYSADQKYSGEYEDAHPGASRNYYRIMVRDIDGDVKYSAVKLLENAAPQSFQITPNPVQDQFSFEVPENFGPGRLSVRVFDGKGAAVYSSSPSVTSGDRVAIDCNRWTRGNYTVVVTGKNDQRVVTAIIKE